MFPYSSTEPQRCRQRLCSTRTVAQLHPSQLQGRVPQRSVKPWHGAASLSDMSGKTKERLVGGFFTQYVIILWNCWLLQSLRGFKVDQINERKSYQGSSNRKTTSTTKEVCKLQAIGAGRAFRGSMATLIFYTLHCTSAFSYCQRQDTACWGAFPWTQYIHPYGLMSFNIDTGPGNIFVDQHRNGPLGQLS